MEDYYEFKKIIGACVFSSFILFPFSTYAQESSLEENTIKNELEKKIAIVDELLVLETKNEPEIKEEFVNQVNQIHIDVENYLASLESDVFYDLEQ